jgi:hypothetical protein
MRWPLNYKGNFLLGRGSWIAERVPSSRGRWDWLPSHALGEVCIECYASRVRDDVAEQDFFTQACGSIPMSKQLTDLSRVLEECKILLCLQETDLEEREAMLAVEKERGLRPTDG